MNENLLPGLPVDLIRAAYEGAPGNEIGSGKFASPESSAALVANSFGVFLNRAGELPRLVGTETETWPATAVDLEAYVRLPWSGRHPEPQHAKTPRPEAGRGANNFGCGDRI